MPDYYVRSTDGNNADSGATWALAEADLHTPTWAAGDRVFVSQAHAQSTAAGISISLAGTIADPTLLLCVNDAAEPPTAMATTASVTTTGNSAINITGQCLVDGFSFQAGTGAAGTTAFITLGSTTGDGQRFEHCLFALNTSSTSQRISAPTNNGTAADGECVWVDCEVKFGSAGQGIVVGRGLLRWIGGGLASGGTSPTTLFAGGSTAHRSEVQIENITLTNASAGINIFTAGTGGGKRVIRNSRLPASWSGVLVSGALTTGERYEMYNCDAGDTNYRLWVEDYAGSIKSETTIVRTGGASDGATPLAWQMVTSSNAQYSVNRLESPEIVQWNETTGSSLTATIEIIHDSQGAGSGSKFQDDEIWLEVMYLGTSGFPLGTWISDCKADVLAAAANQADSSETWTTTGLTTPVKQKLSVTFTPQEKGFIHARVVMAKASKTAYICPKLAVA